MENSFLPLKNLEYGEVEYWQERYRGEKSYEWFVGYDQLKRLTHKYVNKSHSILNLGCGNSPMPLQMHQDGYANITNVDYSPVVIDNMKKASQGMQGLDWMVADIKDLKKYFPEKSYDVIIEKGTLDALLVGEKNQWNYSTEAEDMIGGILEQISVILKEDGRFISVTFSQPHFRTPLYCLRHHGWQVEWKGVGNGFQYLVYVLTKGKPLSKENIYFRDEYLRRKKNADSREKQDKRCVEEDDEDFIFNISEHISD